MGGASSADCEVSKTPIRYFVLCAVHTAQSSFKLPNSRIHTQAREHTHTGWCVGVYVCVQVLQIAVAILGGGGVAVIPVFK